MVITSTSICNSFHCLRTHVSMYTVKQQGSDTLFMVYACTCTVRNGIAGYRGPNGVQHIKVVWTLIALTGVLVFCFSAGNRGYVYNYAYTTEHLLAQTLYKHRGLTYLQAGEKGQANVYKLITYILKYLT